MTRYWKLPELSPWLRKPWLLACLTMLGCWPTLRWYVARMNDGSDEPWGVASLIAAVAISFWRRYHCEALAPARIWAAAVVVVALAGLGPSIMPLLRGVLAVGAVSLLVVHQPIWVGQTGLFLLALPVLSSLQFYGGYPIRFLIGQIGAFVLTALGQPVQAVGAVFVWRGEAIAIDAPCSGVQMLWGSALFACLCICIYGLPTRRAFALLQIASASAFVGNVLRNCLLFYLESGLLQWGSWAHEAIGIGVFAGTLAPAGILAFRWRGARNAEIRPGINRGSIPFKGLSIATLGTACLFGAVMGWRGSGPEVSGSSNVVASERMDAIAESLFAEGWHTVAMNPFAQRFARSFPGEIQVFGRSEKTLVVRVIERATRRYHSSSDCYRAFGYAITPMSLLREADGTLWGRSQAERGGHLVQLRERVEGPDGRGWTDASSWFWAALLGKTEGPWVAYSESTSIY